MREVEYAVVMKVRVEEDGAHCSRGCHFLRSLGNGSMAYPTVWHCDWFHRELEYAMRSGREGGDAVLRCADCRAHFQGGETGWRQGP